MQVDWQLFAFAAVNLIAVVGAYYGLKADNAKLSADVALAMLTERTERQAGQATLKSDLMERIASVDATVKDVTRRVGDLETGQDEWTKALRKRTHELADALQNLVIKVDRLERAQPDPDRGK